MNPMKMFLLSWLLILAMTPCVFAVEVAPRISDREIIEGLAELREGQKSANRRFDDVNQRFDDVNKRFDDVNKRFDDVNKRFDDMNRRFDTIQWMFGLFITISIVLMGTMSRVLWNQQQQLTAMKTSLETFKDELAFLKGLVEKLLPPRAVL